MEYYYKMESPLFTEDGWLDTGDMGYQNEDAFVFFVDRKKDMVNRGGEKIWCTDVEDELIAFKGVKDAAVVGIPNEKYGEVAAAVVVLEKGTTYRGTDQRRNVKRDGKIQGAGADSFSGCNSEDTGT